MQRLTTNTTRLALMHMLSGLLLMGLPTLVLAQTSASSGQGIYTCVDAKGRTLTADRPIADFRLALPFALSVRSAPDSLSLRAPDIDLGGAHLEAEVDIAHIDGNPRVRLWLEAPMQDCGTMLHAVPPSWLPTVGRIDAHGTLGWHAGVMATLPMVGAVHVDLALADTPCTVDKLGAIDLGEFLR